MTGSEEIVSADELLAKAAEEAQMAAELLDKYQKLRKEVERGKRRNHIFATMMETLGG